MLKNTRSDVFNCQALAEVAYLTRGSLLGLHFSLAFDAVESIEMDTPIVDTVGFDDRLIVSSSTEESIAQEDLSFIERNHLMLLITIFSVSCLAFCSICYLFCCVITRRAPRQIIVPSAPVYAPRPGFAPVNGSGAYGQAAYAFGHPVGNWQGPYANPEWAT